MLLADKNTKMVKNYKKGVARTKDKIKEISDKLIEFARYIEQRAELNEEVADGKYQYYYEQLLEIRDDLSEMQNDWWSAESN